MVVIAIIAILAAMLLPALSKARQKARQISCVNNMKTQMMGAILYMDSWDDYVPATNGYKGASGASQMVYFTTFIKPFLGLPYADVNSSASALLSASKPFECPAASDEYANFQYSGHGGYWGASPYDIQSYYTDCGIRDIGENLYFGGGYNGKYYRVISVKQPTSCVYLVDMRNGNYFYQYEGTSGAFYPADQQYANLATKRHGGIFNVGYVDGHIISKKEMSKTEDIINPEG